MLKKEIDLFIKQNVNFKPLKAISLYYSEVKAVELTALRTDKTFVVSGQNSWERHKKLEEVKEFFEFDEEIISRYKDILKQESDFKKEIDKKKEELKSMLTPIDLSMYNSYFLD